MFPVRAFPTKLSSQIAEGHEHVAVGISLKQTERGRCPSAKRLRIARGRKSSCVLQSEVRFEPFFDLTRLGSVGELSK